jgi:hypothetical protein
VIFIVDMPGGAQAAQEQLDCIANVAVELPGFESAESAASSATAWANTFGGEDPE